MYLQNLRNEACQQNKVWAALIDRQQHAQSSIAIKLMPAVKLDDNLGMSQQSKSVGPLNKPRRLFPKQLSSSLSAELNEARNS